MLSKRQIWRRVNSPSSNRMSDIEFDHVNFNAATLANLASMHNFISQAYSTFLNKNNEKDFKVPFEKPCAHNNVIFEKASALTNVNFEKPHSHSKVKFDTSVKVILIATKEEYVEANLSELLWWNIKDYNGFKDESRSEISAVISNMESIGFNEATKLLYQPEYNLLNLKIDNVEDVDKINHLFS